MRLIREIEESFKSAGGDVVEESHFAMKQSSPRMRRGSNDQNVIFIGEGVWSIEEWLNHIIQSEFWKLLNCGRSLNCLK